MTTPDADPSLDELMGVQGSAAVRTMLHEYPQPVGLLWAMRDGGGQITDFEFGYGNPRILELFAMPENMRGRYTLLEAMPQMRDEGSFDLYVEVCETGAPVVDEITFDTPFGDGYARGTLLRRTAKLGDGLIIVLDDVTEQRRMEAELRGYAHAVAHDLSEPVSAMNAIVALLERRAAEPPDPRALELLRETITRARQLIDGVLDYARAGEIQRDQVSLRRLMDEVSTDLGPRLQESGAVLDVRELPEVRGDADPVVADGDDPVVGARVAADLDPRRRLAAELHRVDHQVLQDAPQESCVAADLGQLTHLEHRAGFLQPRAEVRADLVHQPPQADLVALDLAGARVVQNAVDELARAGDRLAQELQRARVGRLADAALEQRHDRVHGRDRLAEVVGDGVRVAAQLGLHAPLLRDVVEHDDEPVAQLGRAAQERATGVPVAEGRVEGDLVDHRHARLADLDVQLEGALVAHRRHRLQQRVAPPHVLGHGEQVEDSRIAVAELEVGDPPVAVADRPQQSHRLRVGVEHRPHRRGSLDAQELIERRILVGGHGPVHPAA